MFDFRLHFYDKVHVNYSGTDNEGNPVIISVIDGLEDDKIGVIVRTIDGTWSETVDSQNSDIHDVETVVNITKQITPVELRELKDISKCDPKVSDYVICFFFIVLFVFQDLIQEYDDSHAKLDGRKNYSFGVLYQKTGQSTEKEIFGNIGHDDEQFERFASLLGDKREVDDDCAVFVNESQGRRLKFYVLTYLPHSSTDSQQCQRKARIGNCVVSVVYQQPGATFSPEIITSQFLHIYIVIRPVEEDKYNISIVTKEDVPDFGPKMDDIVTIDQDNVESFLSKLMQAEQAAYKTGKLAFLRQRYRLAGLMAVLQKLEQSEAELDESTKWRTCTIL